jgi:D-ribose pyranose/furanose isomerase RbsD
MNINLKSFALGASLALGLLGVYALAVTVPNVFAAGDVISAAKMNANFAALEAEVNALKSKNLEFETFKNAAPTAKGTVRVSAAVSFSGTVLNQYSSAGGTITVTKAAVQAGLYSVVIPGIGFKLKDDTVLVTPVNSTNKVCSATELDNQDGIYVTCNNLDGTPANTNFDFVIFNR